MSIKAFGFALDTMENGTVFGIALAESADQLKSDLYRDYSVEMGDGGVVEVMSVEDVVGEQYGGVMYGSTDFC